MNNTEKMFALKLFFCEILHKSTVNKKVSDANK